MIYASLKIDFPQKSVLRMTNGLCDFSGMLERPLKNMAACWLTLSSKLSALTGKNFGSGHVTCVEDQHISCLGHDAEQTFGILWTSYFLRV
jgi:hypothetical protein